MRNRFQSGCVRVDRGVAVSQPITCDTINFRAFAFHVLIGDSSVHMIKQTQKHRDG